MPGYIKVTSRVVELNELMRSRVKVEQVSSIKIPLLRGSMRIPRYSSPLRCYLPIRGKRSSGQGNVLVNG